MKKLKQIIFRTLSLVGKGIIGILSIMCILALFVATMYLIGIIQEKLFLPQDYIMWIFKYPFSNLVFIYEFYIIFGFAYGLSKSFRAGVNNKLGSIKRHKFTFFAALITFNIVVIYTILYNVTVITNNNIIDYSFLSPRGKEYVYSNIIKINTGIYGRKHLLPFAHYSRGDFYYVIQFNDGTKINLTDDGGITKSGDNYTYDNDTRFIIEKLDTKFVDMGIAKVSSMDNFEYSTKNLDKIYTDKIRDIILNTK